MASRIGRLCTRLIAGWRFRQFERNIHPDTWRMHDPVLRWAEECVAHADRYEAAEAYDASPDPVVRQGRRLVEEVATHFAGKLRGRDDLRILVHLPDAVMSPGGHSVISNLIQSLSFLGVAVRSFGAEGVTGTLLAEFRPSVLLVSDYAPFLKTVDWQVVERYRKKNTFLVGLTASLEEYGNSPLSGRLQWARQHGVDFFFSFRSRPYVKGRKAYQPFWQAGYPILSVEFGVNPLVYYPVPGIERDLNYVFLASSNWDKLPRYITFLTDVVLDHPGIIDGPGWPRIRNFTFNARRDRYLYARAKVGLNLHLEEQIEWPCELNERTYMLAACGTPQLVDNPKLLGEHFSRDSFFVASSPRQYRELFEMIVAEPASAAEAALKAQQEVFERHTTFHRADQFCEALCMIVQSRNR